MTESIIGYNVLVLLVLLHVTREYKLYSIQQSRSLCIRTPFQHQKVGNA